MNKGYTTQKLLVLRKLTRGIGEIIGEQMNAYIATLTPLFRQKAVFGDHIQGGAKEPVKGADQAFLELQKLYESTATKQPFNLSRELKSPLMQMTSSLELTPWEYVHVAKAEGESRPITVTCPFKSIITYADYTPTRLKKLLADRNRNESELQQFVLHYLAMQMIISRRPGLAQMLEHLHFPLGTDHLPEFGPLPVTFMVSSISMSLPPDRLLIESTELSGKDAFEEIVNVEDIEKLQDPLKERLLGFIAQQRSKD
ncbi:MAG: hypothetical protein ACREVE_07155 [Gammaproteobacteria bacterium]